MKAIVALACITASSVCLHGVPIPQTGWLATIGGTNFETIPSIAVTRSGEVYAAGNFIGSSHFGSFEVASHGTDDQDAFVVKLAANGNVAWALTIGGSGVDAAYAVAADEKGNAFVAGTFSGTATFSETDLIAASSDAFVAMYSASGRLLWMRQISSFRADVARGLALDNAGNVYVTGSCGENASFDGGSPPAARQDGAFVAKYSKDGDWLWTRFISSGGAEGTSIAVDTIGNVFVTGWFFYGGLFGTNYLMADGSHYSAFVACLSRKGDVAWAKQVGGYGAEFGYGIGVDRHGNVTATGSFYERGWVDGFDLFSDGYETGYVVRLTREGDVTSAFFNGGRLTGSVGYGVAVDDKTGDYFVTGEFSGYWPQHNASTFRNGAYYVDGFVIGSKSPGFLQFSGTGYYLYSYVLPQTVAVDGNGGLYVAGEFRDKATIDGHEATTSSRLDTDAFILKVLTR